MSSPTDMAAGQSSMPASQAGENFINIHELRELIYKQITPMNSHEYSGLFLSCKTINEEATESLFKPRRKLIAAEEKRCSKLYRAPVRIQQPTSISDLRNARVELPQSMFITKLQKYLKLFRDTYPQRYAGDDYNEEEEEENEDDYDGYDCGFDDYDDYDSGFEDQKRPPRPKQRKQPMFSEPLDTLFFTLYADTSPDLINNSKYEDEINPVLVWQYIDGITSTVAEMRKTSLWQRLAKLPMPNDCLLKAETVVFDWGNEVDSENPHLPPFLYKNIDQSHWDTDDWAMSMKKPKRLPSEDGPAREIYKWERKLDWEFDTRTARQQHDDLVDFKVAYKAANGGQDPKEKVKGLYMSGCMWPSDAEADAEATYNDEWPAL